MWSRIVLGLFCFAVLVWSLQVVPGWFPHSDGIRSAAQVAGYNNRIAHLVTVGWILATAALSWSVATRELPEPYRPADIRGSRGSDAILPALVILFAAVLYFPPALAWRGPYFEEGILINAIHRMNMGELPYRDFESLYGPWMNYLPWYWTRMTGFTLTSYYTYILVLETLTLLLVAALIQAHIAGFWLRIATFAVMAQLYFNVMFGPNQNGLRKLLGVYILLSVSTHALKPRYWLIHGAALGFLLGYSQEFGGATAIGIAAIYFAIFVKTGQWAAVPGIVTTALTAFVVWIASVALLLGDDLPTYFTSLRYLTEQFDGGEAAFAFYWTLNGLAVFGLLALGVWLVGRLLAQPWTEIPGPSDLMILGGVAYAAVALKSGLSRADQWHLVPSILVLAFAFMLPLESRYLRIGGAARIAGIVLTCVIAATYSIGQLRIARYTLYESEFAGAKAWISGSEDSACALENQPVYPPLVCTQGEPNSAMLDLANVLAGPEFRDRPIFIYRDSEILGAMTGTRRSGYLTDTFIYGDQRAAEAQAGLAADPDVLVVMPEATYEWLAKGPDQPFPEPYFALSGSGWYRRMVSLVSSAHHPGQQDEFEVQSGRWREFIGNWIVANYEPVYSNGRYVLLQRIAEN